MAQKPSPLSLVKRMLDFLTRSMTNDNNLLNIQINIPN